MIEKEEFYDIEDLEGEPFETEEPTEEISPARKNTKIKKRKKAEPLESKMDLGGKFGFSNLLRNNLGEDKEVDAILRNEFPHQEDVKLHSQLPDYDDFRGYDMGIDEQSEVAKRIFANFHKPSWQTSKRHLFVSKYRKAI